MQSYQKSQKVITPDGEGTVEEIVGDQVSVKLASGEVKSYPSDDLEDDADQG